MDLENEPQHHSETHQRAVDAQVMWSLPDNSMHFTTPSKASAERARAGEGQCGVPWAATVLRGKALIWRMLTEAIRRSNTPAVNWATSLERPGSSPDLPPMEKVITSGG